MIEYIPQILRESDFQTIKDKGKIKTFSDMKSLKNLISYSPFLGKKRKRKMRNSETVINTGKKQMEFPGG